MFCTQNWNFPSPLEASKIRWSSEVDETQLTTVTGQIFENGSWSHELGIRVQQIKIKESLDLKARCGDVSKYFIQTSL